MNCKKCSYSCYSNNKCGCDTCKQAWAEYHKNYKQGRRTKQPTSTISSEEIAALEEQIAKDLTEQMNLIKAQEEWNKSHG